MEDESILKIFLSLNISKTFYYILVNFNEIYYISLKFTKI